MEDRAFRFLRHTLIFIARTLTCGIEPLHIILDEIFMERNQPFYVNRYGLEVQLSFSNRSTVPVMYMKKYLAMVLQLG